MTTLRKEDSFSDLIGAELAERKGKLLMPRSAYISALSKTFQLFLSLRHIMTFECLLTGWKFYKYRFVSIVITVYYT